ncbi:MAG: hypothetical protein GY750_15640 [Lentisphaerae bacterium]|nr:hypothetical protein [Lentisphaerota bacterium]MCP4102830.1 hypothetical protein [Lentisphaerota bacterium]
MNGNELLKDMFYRQPGNHQFTLNNIAFYSEKRMGLGVERIRTPLFESIPSLPDISQCFAKDCIFLSLLSSTLSIKQGVYFTTIMHADTTHVYIMDKRRGKVYRMQKVLPRGRHFGAGGYSRSKCWVRFLEVFMHMRWQAGDYRFKPASITSIFSLMGIDTSDIGTSQAFPSYGNISVTDLIRNSLQNQLPISVSYYPGKRVPHKGIYPSHTYGVLGIDERREKVFFFNPLAHGSKSGLFYLSRFRYKFELSFKETNEQFEYIFGKESAAVPPHYTRSPEAVASARNAIAQAEARDNISQDINRSLPRSSSFSDWEMLGETETGIPRSGSTASFSDWEMVAESGLSARPGKLSLTLADWQITEGGPSDSRRNSIAEGWELA